MNLNFKLDIDKELQTLYTYCKLLKDAKLTNKYGTKYKAVEVLKNAKIVILYFASIYGIQDEKSTKIINCLQELYKVAKFKYGIRIEIVFIPMDDNADDARKCFECQGSWYTLEPNSEEIIKSIFMFEITSSPSVIVLKKRSHNVILNGEEDMLKYGTDVIVSWL